MASCQHRVIVLGASNVALGLGVVVETACRVWGRPLDVLAAIGHGRSYGITSCVLGRSLPAILECDMWHEWKSRAPLPTAALVTDIGNDILFGAKPDLIASWVRKCLDRLQDACQSLIVTELPMASVATLGHRRYRVLRTLLFPRSRITWEQALDRAQQLNDHVVQLASEYGATVVRPDRNWYGLDPIHIRARHRPDAWRSIITSWRTEASVLPAARSVPLFWWNARPKYQRFFGVEQRRLQPTVRFADGTSVSLY